MTTANNTSDTEVATAEQPARRMALSEIGEHLRNQHRQSPVWRELVEMSRSYHEAEAQAFRAATREIIEGFRQQMASALKVDLHALVQILDDVLDQLRAASQTAKALEGVPGTKINFSFTSEVTVNGVRVPDEE